MGGSGSGGFTSSDMARLQKAADDRLRALASKSTVVLFACEPADRHSLDSHLDRSRVFDSQRTVVVDGAQRNRAEQALAGASFLVVFTDSANDTSFLNILVDQALLQRKPGLHVRARPDAIIPSKVTTYRWRSVSWEELDTIFG